MEEIFSESKSEPEPGLGLLSIFIFSSKISSIKEPTEDPTGEYSTSDSDPLPSYGSLSESESESESEPELESSLASWSSRAKS